MQVVRKIFSTFLPILLALSSFAQSDTSGGTLSPEIFQNLYANSSGADATVHWNLQYDRLDDVQNIIIRYRRKIDDTKPWKYTKPLSKKETQFKLEGLTKTNKYVWNIGCRKDGGDINGIFKDGAPTEDQMLWSQKASFETSRPWDWYRFLVLLGSLGLFIFGMKLMSDGLQQSAGGKLRQILSSMTYNRYVGVLSGFLITALVQSSSATTVMTVSFVNAGLLTLVESAGVMMGANIGTTITGWLVSIFGFKVSVSDYSLLILAFGAPMLFVKNSQAKGWANAVIGFAILFMGLGFLKDAVPNLEHDSAIIDFFTQFKDRPFLGRIAFVLLGTLVTVIVQSSSASMALTLTLVSKGIIPFDVAAAMILGENIGTTVTAEIASLIGNVHAKRSARIHSMFNIVGVTWMVLLMPLFLKLITNFLGDDPYTDFEAATLALAAFHTVFNATNVLLTIGFVPLLVRLAIKTVPSKGEEDEIFKLEYISSGITHTPELSLLEAKKEIHKFGNLTLRMSKKVKELLNSTDRKVQPKLVKKLVKYEEITDRMENEIANYLSKISADDLSAQSSAELRAMLSIVNDLERIGDIYYEMTRTLERKIQEKMWFHQKQRESLNAMFALVDQAFEIMLSNLQSKVTDVESEAANSKETEINKLRDKIRKSHLKSIEHKEYNIRAGMAYSNLFASLERVGDHIINVTEALTETD